MTQKIIDVFEPYLKDYKKGDYVFYKDVYDTKKDRSLMMTIIVAQYLQSSKYLNTLS